MYLRKTVTDADENVVDFYKNGFCMIFGWYICHITCYFIHLIFRKIKTNDIWKVCVHFCAKKPQNGKYENQYYSVTYYNDKYNLDGLGVLSVNTYFDFCKYNNIENSIDKSKMITDTFENESLKVLEKYKIEGIQIIRNAIMEIRGHNYVYKGTYKTSLYSPNKLYKVSFHFEWKLDGIDLFISVKKTHSRHDLFYSYLSTIRSDYNSIRDYIQSIRWLSDNEFVSKMADLSGKKIAFVIKQQWGRACFGA